MTGFTPGTGNTGSSATPTFTISGLMQGTTYDVYVRSNCGGNDTSLYVGPETFNTAYGLPFSQSFTNFPTGLNNNPFPENCTINQPLNWNLGGNAVKVYTIKGNLSGSNSFDLNTWESGTGETKGGILLLIISAAALTYKALTSA